jgi:hypothetical protein
VQTEFEFMLPRGYIDGAGNVHRQGTMRLATAMDEIEPMRDMRVRANQAYLAIILLARVITKLGELPTISTSVIERLFAADIAYLQTFYRSINEQGTTAIAVHCPACQHEHTVDLAALGESLATP